jgi:hypothetical protein
MKIKISLIIIFIISLFSINSVEAKNNNFNFKEEIVISDKHEGTTFVGGDKVTITDEASFEGVLFTFGDQLSISGIDEAVFAFGNNINMNENESKDLFLFGSDIHLDNIKVSRDLYALGYKVNINGEIDKDLYIASRSLKIDGIIHGNVYVASPSIEISKGTVITGKLVVPQDCKVKSNGEYTIEYYKIKTNKKTFGDKLLNVIILFINILFVGSVLFFIFKKLNTKITALDNNPISIIKTLLLGVGSVILSLFVFGVLCVLMISKVCTFISIIGIILLVFVYCSSVIYSSYYLTNKVLGKSIKNKYLLLSIGLLVLYLIRLIPIVGTIIFYIVGILGIGIQMKLLLKKEK